MFTDIEGSTRRWEADPTGMQAALTAHDVTLTEAITNHNGQIFKHTGDGICAIFSSPPDAVHAAIAAQRLLQLPVRMGVATGEAQRRGTDYFGVALNRAARVMAVGHGGQILVDGATAELLASIDLIELGVRKLRDITKPVKLFQVSAVGVRTDFPPLRTPESTAGNLRAPTTSLIGRTSEVSDIQATIKAHHLVTLTGVGGVGKTRLALEAARRSADDFPDGVFVIELAPVGDPDAVPAAVAAVLGVTQQPGNSIADSVAAALAGRSRLLVFDNCEHVLDAAADMVEKILASAPAVTILATSREGLRVAGEQLWPVPPLDVGAGITSSAATLFIERAEAIAPRLSLTDQDTSAVVEITRRLDGIPLAIELAAARLMSMTVTEVQENLADCFRLLVGSRRGLERHQTLRHTVQWSYDLLDDDEKSLLERCSVFAGGFELAGAQSVAASDDRFTVVDRLESLVRKSLLVADRSTAHTRFSMLEIIRQFVGEQLARTGESTATRTAHARYYAAQEDDICTLWDGPRQLEAYAWVSTEMANLRAAFRWASDSGDLDTAAAIAAYASLVGFWGLQHEPIGWAEELIEPAVAVAHRRLAQLYSLAVLCFTAGRLDDAVRYAAAGQEAVLSGRFEEVRRGAEASIASPFSAIGQSERWVDWCRTVMSRHPDVHIHTRGIFGLALMMVGADDEAIAATQELPKLAEAEENPTYASWALFVYGTVRRDRAPLLAYAALREGLSIAQEGGCRLSESNIATVLTGLATTHGEPADALGYALVSIGFYYDSGNFFLVKNTLSVLVAILERLGEFDSAAVISGFADESFNRDSHPEFGAAIDRLRDRLGAETYESLSGTGEHMTLNAAIDYAFDQIDRIRAGLRSS